MIPYDKNIKFNRLSIHTVVDFVCHILLYLIFEHILCYNRMISTLVEELFSKFVRKEYTKIILDEYFNLIQYENIRFI